MIRATPVLAIWNFWTVPIRAEPLAAFRIAVAVVMLANLLCGAMWHLDYFCGPEQYVPAECLDDWLARSRRICLLRGPVSIPLLDQALPDRWVSAWKDWGAKPESAYLMFGLYLASLLCMGFGICTRLSTLAAVLLAATFWARLSWLMNGGDSLMRNALYFLLLSPAGATWSVDAWLGRLWARWREQPVSEGPVYIPPWSVRLMQIQLAIVYLFTGFAKMGEDYFNGVAIYWVLNDVAITRVPYTVVPVPMFICMLLTWATLVFEVGFPLFVLLPWTRRWLLLAGIGFHLGILATLEVGWFSQITMCWYLLFVSPEWLAALARRLFGSRDPAAPGIQEPTPAGVAA